MVGIFLASLMLVLRIILASIIIGIHSLIIWVKEAKGAWLCSKQYIV